MIRKCWTKGNSPFRMGAQNPHPVFIDLDCAGPITLDHGVEVYVAYDPKGEQAVVEAKTNAIVGDNLETVRRDVAATTKKIIQEQLRDEGSFLEHRAGSATTMTAEKFWATRKPVEE